MADVNDGESGALCIMFLTITEFHNFAHISLVAFCEIALPSETGFIESGYGGILARKTVRKLLPLGIDVWEYLGNLRNQVAHPFDEKTKTHSKHIKVKEVEDLHKRLQVALQEMFDIWTTSSPSVALAVTVP